MAEYEKFISYSRELASIVYYLEKLTSEEDLVLVTTSHLLSEFIVDRIIHEKCVDPDKILKNKHEFSYHVRLNLIYCMGLIPKPIYDNLIELNTIRNSFAHNLFQEHKTIIYFAYFPPAKDDQESKPIEYKFAKQKDEKARHEFLQNLCVMTVAMLAYYAVFILDIKLPLEKLLVKC